MTTRQGIAEGRAAAATVHMFPDKLAQFFNAPDGPVAKELARRAVQVERRAKQGAPVDTGRLRSSIAWRMDRDGKGVFAQVGSNVVYARAQELGYKAVPAHPYLRPALAAITGALGTAD